MVENTSILLERRLSQKPQINLARSTSGRMWLMSICAFMVVIQSSLTDSFSSLLVAASAVAAAVLTEFLIVYKSGRVNVLKDGSAVASALILSLLLPNRIFPVYAAAGAFFAMAVVKHSFGGLGANWLNPAAGGWLFIRFSWPGVFKAALDGSPLSTLSESLNRGVTNLQGSPLGILRIDSADFISAAGPLEQTVRSVFNETVFSFLKIELPAGYLDLFASRFPGIIADRGVLLLLLGTIIISAYQVNRAWISAVFLAVFGLLVRYAGALPYGGELWNGDVLFALCTGGALTAAFFLAADPATGAKSNGGIFLAAASGGALSFLFRYFGLEPYGMIFAVLFINAALPLIRIAENRTLYERRAVQRGSAAAEVSRRHSS